MFFMHARGYTQHICVRTHTVDERVLNLNFLWNLVSHCFLHKCRILFYRNNSLNKFRDDCILLFDSSIILYEIYVISLKFPFVVSSSHSISSVTVNYYQYCYEYNVYDSYPYFVCFILL